MQSADEEDCLYFGRKAMDLHFGFELTQFLTYEVLRISNNRYGSIIEPTLELRSQRRLLAAMKRVPQGHLDDSELKSAYLHALRSQQ